METAAHATAVTTATAATAATAARLSARDVAMEKPRLMSINHYAGAIWLKPSE
jgi:hypothetical protein